MIVSTKSNLLSGANLNFKDPSKPSTRNCIPRFKKSEKHIIVKTMHSSLRSESENLI